MPLNKHHTRRKQIQDTSFAKLVVSPVGDQENLAARGSQHLQHGDDLIILREVPVGEGEESRGTATMIPGRRTRGHLVDNSDTYTASVRDQECILRAPRSTGWEPER